MQPTTTVVVKTLRVVVPASSDALTTVIAVVGVFLALAALVWQTYSFRRSGSRVSTTLKPGMKHITGTAAITGPASMTSAQMQLMASQGYTTPVIAVEVRNSGRAPTNIVAVGLLFGNGAAYTETVLNPPVPFRLDAESEQTWYFDRSQLTAYGQGMAQIFKGKNPRSVRARVSVGGKAKPVLSQNGLAL
jgi:hypothetical protein